MSHDERVEKANTAVFEKRKQLNRTFYPLYHMAPYANSLHGPSGMVYFKDLYHVFYEHNPYAESWGAMHWGHLTSPDLIQWRHHPIALAPGDDWDRNGCFSGSGVVYEDKLYVFYTGHHWLTDSMDDSQIYQVQCLAVSEDGFIFEKKGMVVKPPSGFTHFRDPKVWYHDKRWWMICGARDAKDQGQLLLYSTDDLEDWDDSTVTVLAKSDDNNIFMWECPDFFPFDKNYVLLYSPQGIEGDGYQYRNRYQSGALVGDWKDCQTFVPVTKFRELDCGHDFYAPQTFLAKDGRRILIGWLDMWDSIMPTKEHKWSGMLTIPRVLTVDQTGRIRCHPIKEMESLRRSHQYLQAQAVRENSQLLMLQECISCEVKIIFDVENSTAEKYGLWLGKGLEIYIDNQSRRVILNRHYPEYTISGYRSCPLNDAVLFELHIFFDKSSVEVFINSGDAVMSSRIFPPGDDRALSLFAIHGTAEVIHCDLWELDEAVQ